jgi:signal transduction histidine kinase
MLLVLILAGSMGVAFGDATRVLGWTLLTGLGISALLGYGVRQGCVFLQRRQRCAVQAQATVLRLGEARGRQAILDEVRMLEHAQLKAHVVALQRCLAQARLAVNAGECDDWLKEGSAQCRRLLQVVIGLHEAAGTSAVPDDVEQAACDTVASLAVAYPDCACTLDVQGARPPHIGPSVQQTVLLVLYNALHNAYTHAHPSAVQIRLQYAPDALIMLVRDNGSGSVVPTAMHRGRGLRDMAQRVAACGGHLRIDANPGGGTVVRATLPLVQKENHDDLVWQTLAPHPGAAQRHCRSRAGLAVFAGDPAAEATG